MTITDDLWVTASADRQAEQAERLLAVAQVRCAQVWPFLAAASSAAEYDHRRALAAEQVAAACDSVSPRDPGLVSQVLAGFDADYQVLGASRAPMRSLHREVEAELARRGASARSQTLRVAAARALLTRMARVGHLRAAAGDQPAAPEQPVADPEEGPDDALRAPEPLSVGAPRTAAGWSGTNLVDCPKCRGTGEMPSQYLDESYRGKTKPACDLCVGDGAVPASEAHDWHGASRTAGRKHSLLAACVKCAAGRTPDGAACRYCDGAGELDPTTAMVKAADGWDQGLVRLTAEGAVSFDPNAFGSERWQRLPTQPAPAWIVDQYGPTNDPLVGGTPNPLSVMHGPSGMPLRDNRSYRPPVRARLRVSANPYLDDNPYRTDGPGRPDDTPRRDDPRLLDPDLPPEVPLASGAAQPVQYDERVPHPADETGQRRATRQPAPEFSGRPATVVDRLAARVLAANPRCSPADARRVALATLNRFPAVAGRRG